MRRSQGEQFFYVNRKGYQEIFDTASSCLNLFLICSCLLSITFFMYGFFPVKYISREISSYVDLPSQVLDIRVNPQEFYHPRVGRLVFMVVDALRWDFLTKSDNVKNLPHITKLLQSKEACLYHAQSNPPTVTMPRLKALMTGSVPNFIDVVLNFGSTKVKGDSLIVQAVNNSKKMVFYGDDTWLKMFPSVFLRSEGTTSFFVSDYEEVDYNVTRHLPKELKASDWDVMLLHYLGLDHIGHLAGPSSPLVGPKLREMDKVVQMILEELAKTNNTLLPSLLVLLGDHGMRNSGGHGGSTMDEILTSLLMVLPGCSESKWFKQHVWQVDVTPTLAVLLGLPIPHNSVGTLLPGALASLPPMHHLYAQHYNALHLKTLAHISQCDISESLITLQSAEKIFARLLSSNVHDTALYEQSVRLYESASQKMSKSLLNSDVGFHLTEMVAACCILLMALVTMVENHFLGIKKVLPPKSILWTTALCSSVAIIFFGKTAFVLVLTGMFGAFSSTLWIRPQTPVMSLIRKLRGTSASTIFLYLGCVVQAASLLASSLIEEEHQTWYFFWATIGLIKFYTISVHIYRKKAVHKESMIMACKLFMMIAAHRFLRTLNQTGDKWADLPDTSDWLKEAENWWIHFLFTTAGLVGVWASLLSVKREKDFVYDTICGFALVLALLCRAATDEVQLPFSYPKSKGVAEGHVFWVLLLLSVGHQVLKRGNLLDIVISTIMLILSLLLRPHNVVILPYITYASGVLFSVCPLVSECTVAHAWMGSAAFFYMGNSNSLTTVDVAAGYIGSSGYSALRVGLMIFLHTYAAPIVSFLLLFRGLTENVQLRKGARLCLEVTFLQKMLPLFFSCLNCIFLRHHLFVWSVFAPKLLYEVMSLVTVTLLVTPIWVAMYFLLYSKDKA